MRLFVGLFSLLLLNIPSFADTKITTTENPMYISSAKQPFETVYKKLYKALEAEKFWVVFEPNIGKSLERMKEKMGKNHNKNKLENINSLVFCNIHYVNKISNLDPNALGICPLSATLIHKEGTTTVMFPRPSTLVPNSPAIKILKKIEKTIIKVIDSALSAEQDNKK